MNPALLGILLQKYRRNDIILDCDFNESEIVDKVGNYAVSNNVSSLNDFKGVPFYEFVDGVDGKALKFTDCCLDDRYDIDFTHYPPIENEKIWISFLKLFSKDDIGKNSGSIKNIANVKALTCGLSGSSNNSPIKELDERVCFESKGYTINISRLSNYTVFGSLSTNFSTSHDFRVSYDIYLPQEYINLLVTDSQKEEYISNYGESGLCAHMPFLRIRKLNENDSSDWRYTLLTSFLQGYVFEIDVGDTRGTAYYTPYLISDTPLIMGTWNKIMIQSTRDGNTIRYDYYINGQLFKTHTDNGNVSKIITRLTNADTRERYMLLSSYNRTQYYNDIKIANVLFELSVEV